MSGNPSALHLGNPLEMHDAREAAHRLAIQRREAERWLQESVEKAAETEAHYRRCYAKVYMRLTGPVTEREAQTKALTADEGYERDLAAGMVKVATERLRGLEGERAILRQLTEWSAKMLGQS